ncbi:MAG: helix-turn-helix transcriptional regulator [Candidatus Eremiobacteraeota bacterium]|nr:helix-turn-helix transcriptional regulator [Candidatus Eremiobacteraeota bacterium]
MNITTFHGLMSFGERVRERRSALKLSQARLAELVTGDSTKRQLIYGWEQDKGRPSHDEWMTQLAKALQTSISYLYGETDDPRPAPDWHSKKGASSAEKAARAGAIELLMQAIKQLGVE